MSGAMAMDSRLLPRGFVWGMAIIVVYAVARVIAFGFDFHVISMCAVILPALVAAVYTHYQKPAPPDDAAIRREGFSKRGWSLAFWAGVFAVVYMDLLTQPGAELQNFRPAEWWLRLSFVSFIGALAWGMVRLPFLALDLAPACRNARRKTAEGRCLLALLLFGFSPFAVMILSNLWLVLAASAMIALGLMGRYARYLISKKRGDNHERGDG